MDKNANIGPMTLRARTLDLYVAFLVFFIAISGLLDPTWPERFAGTATYWVIMIEDIYLMIASTVIMISLLVREFKKCSMKLLVPTIVGEMFGWLFISAASFVIVITSWWIPPSSIVEEGNTISLISWVCVWLGLGVSAFFRYLDLRLHYRSQNK